MTNTTTSLSDFSLIVPAYNEEENIDLLMKEIDKTFKAYDLHGEVILVDDGSTDGTYEAAKRYETDLPYLKTLRHRKNFGKTEAIVTGVYGSQGSVVIIFDADLQHLPEEIPRFLKKIDEGYDIVTGRKVGDYQKKYVSYIYNKLCRKLFDVPVSDMNSIKAFRREVFQGLHLRHDWHRFFVAICYSEGYTVTEIDVPLYPRRFGEPKYGGYGRMIIGMLDLLAVKFKTTFARKPLLFFGSIGLALMLLGTLIGLFAIYLRVFLQLGFRPLLYLVVLLILMGAICFIGGFIGEIVGDISDRLASVEKKSLE